MTRISTAPSSRTTFSRTSGSAFSGPSYTSTVAWDADTVGHATPDGAAAVAVGWSQYLNEFLDNVFGFTIPDSLSNAPEADGVINLPAIAITGRAISQNIRGGSRVRFGRLTGALVVADIAVSVAAVGMAFALGPEDHIFGSHRSHGEILAKGFSAIRRMTEAQLLGIMESYRDGALLRPVERDHHGSVKELAVRFFIYGAYGEIAARWAQTVNSLLASRSAP